AHFFGRGLNEQATPDDFGDHNKLVHPELLDKLAKDFATYGRYDLKQLITWICNSRPYQLSCVANDTNGKPEHEVFFSRMLLKNMSPEQLFGSLSVALYPLKDGGTESVEAKKKKREDFQAKLVRNFGDDEGNEVSFNGTVVQALLMMNGSELNSEL